MLAKQKNQAHTRQYDSAFLKMRVAMSVFLYASIAAGEVSRSLEGLYPGRLQADSSKHFVCTFFERELLV